MSTSGYKNHNNFNPRSRVGNDKPVRVYDIDNGISIHVPAWGTTRWWRAQMNKRQFQSTFPRGERQSVHDFLPSDSVFQSTFPRGERLWSICRFRFIYISIHVPAWGTTEITSRGLQVLIYFNPRSRVGNDVFPVSNPIPSWISIHVPAWGTTITYSQYNNIRKFQSTFPRGERRVVSCIWSVLFKFQSTFPRGERLISLVEIETPMLISIHVPAWGTTLWDCISWYHK